MPCRRSDEVMKNETFTEYLARLNDCGMTFEDLAESYFAERGECNALRKRWDALREWLGYGLERLDPDLTVKAKWHTEHVLKAMDRLDAGESAFVDLCGMCDEVLKRRGSL